MNIDKYSKTVLYITFILVLFYPFKGLLSVFLSLTTGGDVSSIITRYSIYFTFCFILLNLIVNDITFLTKVDKLLLYAGIFGMLVGIARRDILLFYNTFLLFGLPVLFTQFRKINDVQYFRVIYTFFTISALYMFMEGIILHPQNYGLNFEPPSTEQIQAYSNLLLSGKAKVVDFRNTTGMFVRTGGYLGNMFSMPVILSMTAVFFYVVFREKGNIKCLVLSIISIITLITSLSSTGLISFIVTIYIYELYVRKNYKLILLISFVFLGIFSYMKTGIYLFQRLATNLLYNPSYYNKFFGFYSEFSNPLNILYFLVGSWKSDPANISSHVDMILIPSIYGIIIAFLLYRRMILPTIICRNANNFYFRIFSLTILPAFFCLYHHHMTLNINVMFLVTVFIVKSGQIVMQINNHKYQYDSP